MEIMNRIYAADHYYLVLEVDRCAGGQDELYTSEMSAETRVVQHRPTVVISSVHISIVLVTITVRATNTSIYEQFSLLSSIAHGWSPHDSIGRAMQSLLRIGVTVLLAAEKPRSHSAELQL